MDTRVFCVYNQARRVFLSSKVTIADGANQPLKVLKVLVTALALDAESCVWLSPVNATPQVPRLFPFDLAYLDQDHRVLEMVEVVPGVEFPPYRREVASALVLPLNTLRSTQTQCGDQFIVCLQQEADELLKAIDTPEPAPIATVREAMPRMPAQRQETARVESVAVSAVASQAVAAVQEPAVAVAVAESVVEVADPPEVISAPVDAPRPLIVPPEPAPVTAPSNPGFVAETAAGLSRGSAASGVEAPPVSITEVVLERPVRAPLTQPAAEHVGLMEDLFANWVESPAAPPSWIAQKAHSIAPKVDPASNGKHADLAPAPTPAKDEAAIAADVSAQPEAKPAIEHAEKAPAVIEAPAETSANAQVAADNSAGSPETVAQPAQTQKPERSAAVERRAKPAPPSPPVTAPAPIVIPQPVQTVAFTVAQYGMWKVNAPTAVSPVVPVNGQAAEKVVESAPRKADTVAAKPVETASPEAPKSTTASELSASSHPVASALVKPVSDRHIARLSEEKLPTSEATAKKPKSDAAPEVPIAEATVEKQEQSASPVTGKTEGFAAKAEDLEAKTPSVWPKKRTAKWAPDPGAQSAVPEQPTVERGSDWLTNKILEATGKPAPAEFAASVQEKLEKLQTKAPVNSGEAPAPKVESALEKKSSAKPVPAATTPSVSLPANGSAAKAADKKDAAADAQNELSMTLPMPHFLKADQKNKLRISIQRVESNGKNEVKPASLGTRFKRWLHPTSQPKSDRRRANRRYVPGMVAHYYTGGAPKPHEIADISLTGFYLLTQDRWMPDTMIQMTLQKPCAKGERKQSITVLSKIVRRGSDGVAAEFVMAESLDPLSRDVLPSQATDKFALARFI